MALIDKMHDLHLLPTLNYLLRMIKNKPPITMSWQHAQITQILEYLIKIMHRKRIMVPLTALNSALNLVYGIHWHYKYTPELGAFMPKDQFRDRIWLLHLIEQLRSRNFRTPCQGVAVYSPTKISEVCYNLRAQMLRLNNECQYSPTPLTWKPLINQINNIVPDTISAMNSTPWPAQTLLIDSVDDTVSTLKEAANKVKVEPTAVTPLLDTTLKSLRESLEPMPAPPAPNAKRIYEHPNQRVTLLACLITSKRFSTEKRKGQEEFTGHNPKSWGPRALIPFL